MSVSSFAKRRVSVRWRFQFVEWELMRFGFDSFFWRGKISTQLKDTKFAREGILLDKYVFSFRGSSTSPRSIQSHPQLQNCTLIDFSEC